MRFLFSVPLPSGERATLSFPEAARIHKLLHDGLALVDAMPDPDPESEREPTVTIWCLRGSGVRITDGRLTPMFKCPQCPGVHVEKHGDTWGCADCKWIADESEVAIAD